MSYVFFDEVEATITRDECCDLLSVLDELNTDTLTHGRVRLLGLNTAVVVEERKRKEIEDWEMIAQDFIKNPFKKKKKKEKKKSTRNGKKQTSSQRRFP